MSYQFGTNNLLTPTVRDEVGESTGLSIRRKNSRCQTDSTKRVEIFFWKSEIAAISDFQNAEFWSHESRHNLAYLQLLMVRV